MLITLIVLIFGLHVVLANLGIGLSTVIPLMKRKAEKDGNEALLAKAKRLMRFYASTYGLAGVLGTAFTVFLLSFYPDFIGLAGNIAFTPFALSVLLIALHFLCIVLYWYGWDKFDANVHFAIGVTMAISAVLIPLGFRAIFGFLNVPIGLEIHPKLHLDTLKALSNPTFLALYPKSILASYALTFIILAYDDRRFAKLGLIALTATAILGIVYAETLRELAAYKFNNAISSPIFFAKMAFVSAQFIALIAYLKWNSRSCILAAGAFALTGVFMGEILNAFSQYPYLIVNTSILPENVRVALAPIINLAHPNPLTNGLTAITLAFLIPLLLASALLIRLVTSEPSPSSRTR